MSHNIGDEKSKIKAAELFKKAADKGFINAMFNYANILKEGEIIPVNIKEAIKYYKMAAASTLPFSASFLTPKSPRRKGLIKSLSNKEI